MSVVSKALVVMHQMTWMLAGFVARRARMVYAFAAPACVELSDAAVTFAAPLFENPITISEPAGTGVAKPEMAVEMPDTAPGTPPLVTSAIATR